MEDDEIHEDWREGQITDEELCEQEGVSTVRQAKRRINERYLDYLDRLEV